MFTITNGIENVKVEDVDSIIDYFRENYQDWYNQEDFNNLIDSMTDDIEILGIKFLPSKVLYTVDEVSYSIAEDQYINNELEVLRDNIENTNDVTISFKDYIITETED